MDYVIDAIGLFGVGLIVLAYFCITSRRLNGEDVRYHLLNMAGAILLLISLMFNWNTPSVIIEIVWVSISGYGIWRCWRKRNS